jgi:hypothetical protein
MIVYKWYTGEDLTSTVIYPYMIYNIDGNQYLSYLWYGYNVVTFAI